VVLNLFLLKVNHFKKFPMDDLIAFTAVVLNLFLLKVNHFKKFPMDDLIAYLLC